MQTFRIILMLALITPVSQVNTEGPQRCAPEKAIDPPQAQQASTVVAPARTANHDLLLRALEQPDIQPLNVVVAWAATELEATPHVDAPLAMALMWAESRYQPTAGPACGVMQVYPHDIGLADASSCALWKHDVRAGVRAGVVEIETMLADRRVHNLREALLYRACGNRAFTGECRMSGWVGRVLARRASLVRGARPKV